MRTLKRIDEATTSTSEAAGVPAEDQPIGRRSAIEGRPSVRSAPATSSVRVRTHYASASSDPPATPAVGADRVLSIRLVGQTRPDVRLYQLALDRLGFNLAADGRLRLSRGVVELEWRSSASILLEGKLGVSATEHETEDHQHDSVAEDHGEEAR